MIRRTHQALRCLPTTLCRAKTFAGLVALALATNMMVGCGGSDAPAMEEKMAANDEAPSDAPAEPMAPKANNRGGGGGNGRELIAPPGAGNGRELIAPPGAGNGRDLIAPPGAGNGRDLIAPPGAGGGPASRPGGNAAGGPPPEPPRSQNYAVWTAEDYRDAVRERDQALVGGIEWLASNKADDASAKLLIELLVLANEPAKQPPGGAARGGRPGGRGPGGRGPGGGGGQRRVPPRSGNTGAEIGSLDSAVLKEIIIASLTGDVQEVLLASVLVQDGRPQGYGGGDGQNGPPPGYGGGDGQNGPPQGYGGGDGQNGPPQGYGGGDGQNGPPQGYGGGDASRSNGPPPGYNAGIPGGGGGARNDRNRTGGGNRTAPPASGDFSHYGTLDMNQFVGSVVTGLIQIDSPKAWDGIARLLEGSISSPIDADATTDMVLQTLMKNYGGPGHPTHLLLTGLIKKDSPGAAKAVALFTDYAGTAIDQLFGMVEPATDENSQVANGGNTRGLGGRNGGFNGRQPSGGGGNRTLAGPGGSAIGGEGGGGRRPTGGGGNRALSRPGGGSAIGGEGGGGRGRGGRNAAANGGGGQAPPAQNIVSISMQSNLRPMTPDQLRNFSTFLWNPDFTEAVSSRLAASPGLSESGQMLALAGSLPTQNSRSAYFDFLSQNSSSPDSFINAGFFNRIARDPGVLVALKGLSQKKRSPGSLQSRWDEATKQAALALRDRLLASAERSGSSGVVPASMIKLHENATPDVVLRQSWPRDISSAIGESQPGSTEVLFVRVRAADNLKRVLSHYSRRVGSSHKKAERDDADRRISWLTGVKTLKTGMKRSIDVIFSEDSSGGRAGGGRGPGGPGGGRGPGGPGGSRGGGGSASSAIIDIVVVDTPNPNLNANSASLDR